MKLVPAAWAGLFLVVAAAAGLGVTIRVPTDEPVANVHVPENWRVHQQKEFVEATSSDGACHLLVWTVEGIKVADSMGEAIRYIKRDGTVVVRPNAGRREPSKLDHGTGTTLSWDAFDKGQPITIRCHAIELADRKWILLLVWGSEAEQNKHRAELSDILRSVKGAR